MSKLMSAILAIVLVLALAGVVNADDYQQQMTSIYQMLGRKEFDVAQAALAKILKTKPNDSLALNNLAYIMVAEKKCPGALELLKRAGNKAKGVKIHNEVTKIVAACPHIGLFTACQPKKDEANVADLEDVIKSNIATIQDMMKPLPK